MDSASIELENFDQEQGSAECILHGKGQQDCRSTVRSMARPLDEGVESCVQDTHHCLGGRVNACKVVKAVGTGDRLHGLSTAVMLHHLHSAQQLYT